MDFGASAAAAVVKRRWRASTCAGAHSLVTDAGALCLLGLLAMAGGVLLNASRREPLPLFHYASRAEKVQAVVAGLSGGRGSPPAPVAQVGLEDLRKIVTARTALILDARPDVFYGEGHIPGALNLARTAFARDYARLRGQLEADKNWPIVVYCADSECPDSGLVASGLSHLGYGQVRQFAGGWEAWTQAGLPQERQEP